MSNIYELIKLTKEDHEIVAFFLNNHYFDGNILYDKHYYFWLLSNIPKNLAVGLSLNNKLIGTIFAIPMDFMLKNNHLKIANIRFLCIHKKLRNLGLSKILIKELKKNLQLSNYDDYVHLSDFSPCKFFSEYFIHKKKIKMIPINIKKLKKIQFIDENEKDFEKIIDNPLRLARKEDIFKISHYLNCLENSNQLYRYFDPESCKRFIISKKNVIYTYIRDDGEQVTDLITFTVFKQKYGDKILLKTAKLHLFNNSSMETEELLICLANKLYYKGIDQITYSDNIFDDTNIINFNIFDTETEINYFNTQNIFEPNDKLLEYFS